MAWLLESSRTQRSEPRFILPMREIPTFCVRTGISKLKGSSRIPCYGWCHRSTHVPESILCPMPVVVLGPSSSLKLCPKKCHFNEQCLTSSCFSWVGCVTCDFFGTCQVLKMVTEFMPPWYTDSEVERVQWLNKIVNKVSHSRRC